MKPGDKLVATIHTHSHTPGLSVDDLQAGDALGVPMAVIAPGAERARVYYPEAQTIVDMLVQGRRTRTVRGPFARSSSNEANEFGTNVGRNREEPRVARSAHTGLIAISEPNGSAPENYVAPSRIAGSAVRLIDSVKTWLRPPLIDRDVLARVVQMAADDPDTTADVIWWNVTQEAIAGKFKVSVAPDPDLFRAIVGVAQRDAPESRDSPTSVLVLAKQQPLYLAPGLLDAIVKYAQQTPMQTHSEIWRQAWWDMLVALTPAGKYAAVGLPTPPDLDLFDAIVTAARLAATPRSILPDNTLSGADSREIQRWAHELVGTTKEVPAWPRYIDPNLLAWVVYWAEVNPHAGEIAIVSGAYNTLLYFSLPRPDPTPQSDLLAAILRIATRIGGSPRDVLNTARADMIADELWRRDLGPCGHRGQKCCSLRPCEKPGDGCDVCLDFNSICDWDGRCTKNTWPPQSAYQENITLPGVELDTDWTNEVQGLASDGEFWYVVQGKGVNRLWKVPFDIAWAADWGDIPGLRWVGRKLTTVWHDHWGDPEVHKGKVYVPLEEDSGPYFSTNAVAEFDAETLEYLGQSLSLTNHAASIAVHPITGEFYIESNYDGGLLHVYAPRGEGPFNLGQPIRKIPLETPPGVVVNGIQGIAFSSSGRLYVSSDQLEAPGIYCFQVSPNRAQFIRRLFVEEHKDEGQELEGLTVFDMTWDSGARNQIHVFVLNNIGIAKDNAWFKHISVDSLSRL